MWVAYEWSPAFLPWVCATAPRICVTLPGIKVNSSKKGVSHISLHSTPGLIGAAVRSSISQTVTQSSITGYVTPPLCILIYLVWWRTASQWTWRNLRLSKNTYLDTRSPFEGFRAWTRHSISGHFHSPTQVWLIVRYYTSWEAVWAIIQWPYQSYFLPHKTELNSFVDKLRVSVHCPTLLLDCVVLLADFDPRRHGVNLF
jgi:hypothetical protein